jgi:hypothetical protein
MNGIFFLFIEILSCLGVYVVLLFSAIRNNQPTIKAKVFFRNIFYYQAIVSFNSLMNEFSILSFCVCVLYLYYFVLKKINRMKKYND